ncbi:hypothetical protein FACS1894130_09510 [Spirochaetia bacterium]|nr:hypothetical protein FACS1894130_09510 [Spirochaetia bacterium]
MGECLAQGYTGGLSLTMADPELVWVLDYILNRCDEHEIEAVSAAVVRRRRDLTMFGGAHNLPDPQKMARELSGQINIGATLDGLKDTVRDMAVRIIRQEAPELTDEQIAELTRAWVPAGETGIGDASGDGGPMAAGVAGTTGGAVSPDVLGTMIGQFIDYSVGRMDAAEEAGLRAEMGAWPERYWKAFPQVIQLIIGDFLKGEMTEGEFNTKIGAALAL